MEPTIDELDSLIGHLEQIRIAAKADPDYGFDNDWDMFIRKMRCLPSQAYGKRLERWLTKRWGWTTVPASANKGDVTGAEGRHWEVKVSLMSPHSKKANFVQIRPHQHLDGGYQLFVVDAENQLHRFVLTPAQMTAELTKIGHLAHGVVGDEGEHTEHAIRLTWSPTSKHLLRWERRYSRPGLPNGHTVDTITPLS